ncbi:hypothetical protein Clacol_010011 [Clathrus columnatus]|uniref:HIT domain-containing protein n=1 Tax=Clathrus columnatus TaxID=1419009 RepID=A0AAV5ASX2_9AGAM|nr:hypothetical protein Clacol_010011 [Clathrus columnatus]
MAMHTLSPRFRQLQPELILQIFEAVVAQGDINTALMLSHISSWVQPVVESQIYHTVVLFTTEQIASFAYVVKKRPASFFKKHVRRLWIAPQQIQSQSTSHHRNNISRTIANILAACNHVDDLSIDQSYLTTENGNNSESFNNNNNCRPTFVFMVTSSMIFCNLPTVMLSNVTHLYLLNGQIHPDTVQKISKLPRLTHMAVSYAMNANMAYILRTINALLQSRTLVRLLILPWQMFASSASSAGQSSVEASATFSLEQSRLMAELNKLKKDNQHRIVLIPKIIGRQEQFKLWKNFEMSSSDFFKKVATDTRPPIPGPRPNRCAMDDRSLFVHKQYRGANQVEIAQSWKGDTATVTSASGSTTTSDNFCVFCRIVQNVAPAFKIFYQYDQRVSELPPNIAAAVGAAVSKVANALTKALNNTALNIVCNQEYAQAVPHVHYHIVPAPVFDNANADHATLTFAPLTNFEMHRQEFLSRHSELDDEEGHRLCQNIKSKL